MKGVKTILTMIAAYAGLLGAGVAAYNQFVAPGYGLSGFRQMLMNIPATVKNSWQNYVYGAVVLVAGFWLIGMWKSKGTMPTAIKAVLMFLVAMYGSAYIFGGIKGVAWAGTGGAGGAVTSSGAPAGSPQQANALKGMN